MGNEIQIRQRRFRLRLTRIVAILLLVALVAVLKYTRSPGETFTARGAVWFEFFVGYLIAMLAFRELIPAVLERRQSWKELSFKKRLSIITVCLAGIGFLTSLAFGHFMVQSYKTDSLAMTFQRFQITVLLMIGIVLLPLYLDDLKQRTEEATLENERLRSQNLSSQLQLIRQQIRPHFLFNSLNSLLALIRSNDKKAEEFVLRLSELYRYRLQANVADKVTIREELQIVDSFLFMLKSRFEDNLVVTVDIRETLLETYIPPFALQTLIENAVKHNIISKAKPLRIEISNSGQKLVVRNSLQEKKYVEGSSHIGLANLNQSYLLMCGRGIEINKTGEEFEVTLPVMAR